MIDINGIIFIRDLIVSLSMQAIKRGVPVTIVAWSNEIVKTVALTADMFMQDAGGLLTYAPW